MPRKTKADRNEYARKWRAANIDRVNAQARARHAANPEPRRAQARERSRRWYALHGDRVRTESKEWRAANPEASRQMTREWRAANPDKVRDLHLKRYGITSAEWDAMFEAQGRRCAACGSTEPNNKRGWHTDHDHNTGVVRGILCHHCNVTLGKLGDCIEGVQVGCARLARYLEGPISKARLPPHAGLLSCL